MEKKITTPLTMGVIISLILIVLGVVGYIAAIDQQSWYKWISILIFFGGIIYTCINYGKQSNNNVTFGNTFAFGFKTTAVVTCIMIVFIVVFLMVFPDIKEKALDTARKQMEEKKQMTEDQIDTAVAFTKKSFLVILIVFSLFMYLVAGLIAALIGAAVTKKEPQSPFENQP